MCGLIGEKDESNVSQNVRRFDDTTMNLIREERMFKLVTQDFLSDRKNFFGTFQQFFRNMSLFQLAKIVEDILFEDLAIFLRKELN